MKSAIYTSTANNIMEKDKIYSLPWMRYPIGSMIVVTTMLYVTVRCTDNPMDLLLLNEGDSCFIISYELEAKHNSKEVAHKIVIATKGMICKTYCTFSAGQMMRYFKLLQHYDDTQ